MSDHSSDQPGEQDLLDTIRTFRGRPAYLDRAGQPMTLRQWGEAVADRERCLVKRTQVGDAEVITMWMGVDNDPISNPVPLIFGSIIRRGREWESEIESPTEEAALEAHQILVNWLQSQTRP